MTEIPSLDPDAHDCAPGQFGLTTTFVLSVLSQSPKGITMTGRAVGRVPIAEAFRQPLTAQ